MNRFDLLNLFESSKQSMLYTDKEIRGISFFFKTLKMQCASFGGRRNGVPRISVDIVIIYHAPEAQWSHIRG